MVVKSDIPEPGKIKKILVVKFRHIGDVLLTVPAIRALKEALPDTTVSALVNSGTEDVLAGNPLVDDLICFDTGIKSSPSIRRYIKEAGFLNKIRAEGFDLVIDMTGGDRAAIVSLASGAGYRVGWKSGKGFMGKKYIFTHSVEPDGRKHTILQNLDMVNRLGIHTGNLSVDFHIPEKERIFARDLLKDGKKENIATIHVHPTSRWLFKCWTDQYMAEVMGWLVELGAMIAVTSSPEKRELEKAKQIISLVSSSNPRHSSHVLDLCGRTTIKQLGAISEASDVFFGVDSAPMHIAAAVNTPVVALFGPSGAYNWGPWDNEISGSGYRNTAADNPYSRRNGIQTFGIHTVIQREWECIPCGKDGCNGSKKSRCLDDIDPDTVKKVIIMKLEEIKK